MRRFQWFEAVVVSSSVAVSVPTAAWAQENAEFGLQILEGRLQQTLERHAADILATAQLPMSLDAGALRVVTAISAGNLREQAREVLLATAIPRIGPTGLEVISLDEAELSDEELERLVDEMIESGLVREEFYTAVVPWRLSDGSTFSTLATMDPAGAPAYEPILHFTASVSESSSVERGSWLGRWQLAVKNGLGLTCVDVEWDVKVSSNGGAIIGPEPYVSVERQLANCFLWKQATTDGEVKWCRPTSEDVFPDCRTEENEPGEECLDWVVATYVATGLSDVEVDATAGGVVKGIPVQAKVSFNTGRIGTEGRYERTGRICALSGPDG